MKKTLLFMLPLALLTSVLAAQEITLEEYLDLVKKNHPFFTQEALAVQIQGKQAQVFRGVQDWVLSAAPSYTHLGKASAYEYGGAGKIERVGLEAGLQRALWPTGGKLALSFSSDYAHYARRYELPAFTAGTSEEGIFLQGFGLSYSQPLLKNLGGKLDRLGFELSDYAVRVRKIQALENQEGFMLERALQFLAWALLSEEIVLAEERLGLAKEQLSQVRKRYRANLVARVDLLRGEEAVRGAEQSLLKLRSLWKARQAELAVLAQSEELYERRPALDLYSLESVSGQEQGLASLKEKSRLLSTFTLLRQQLAHQREGLREQKRAALNLKVAAGLAGRDEEFLSSLRNLYPDASVSLEFSTTLENRTLNAKIEKVDLQVDQLLSEMREAEINMEASLRQLLIQMADMQRILELNRIQIASARAKTEEELKLYNQGRGQLIFVIQSRDNAEGARLDYAQNAALYQSLFLRYRALMDELWPGL